MSIRKLELILSHKQIQHQQIRWGTLNPLQILDRFFETIERVILVARKYQRIESTSGTDLLQAILRVMVDELFIDLNQVGSSGDRNLVDRFELILEGVVILAEEAFLDGVVVTEVTQETIPVPEIVIYLAWLDGFQTSQQLVLYEIDGRKRHASIV